MGISNLKLFLTGTTMLTILVSLGLLHHAILNENKDYEYASYGMFIASISVFGVLLINESCRSSVRSIFKHKEVLSAELNEYFGIINERM